MWRPPQWFIAQKEFAFALLWQSANTQLRAERKRDSEKEGRREMEMEGVGKPGGGGDREGGGEVGT